MNRFLLSLWCALLALPLSAAPLLNSYTFSSGVAAPTDYILQWRFNGDALDTTTTWDGTVFGTEAYTTGQTSVASTAFSFNGSNADVRRASFANFTSESFSITLWVYVNSGNLAVDPVLVWKGAYQTSGYYGGLAADGRFYFGTHQSGANQSSETVAGAFTEGAWYHIAIVRSGASIRIYKNGSDITSTAATHANPTSAAGNPYGIGAYGLDGSPSNRLNGRIDDHRVYDYALTAGQVAAIYAANAQ